MLNDVVTMDILFIMLFYGLHKSRFSCSNGRVNICAFLIIYSILQIKILEISGYIIPLTYISLPIIYCCPRPNPLHAKVAKCNKNNLMWQRLPQTYKMSVVFCRLSAFLNTSDDKTKIVLKMANNLVQC